MRSNQNKKKLIIAIVFGLLASFMVFNSINGEKSTINHLQQQLAEQSKLISSLKERTNNAVGQTSSQISGMTNVVYTRILLKPGTVLTADMLEEKELRTEIAPKDSFNNLNIMVGRIVSETINPGEYIPISKIVGDKLASLDVPVGTRAITVPLNNIQGFASYITVGSKVDIISINNENKANLILQNIKIISMDNGSGSFVNINSRDSNSSITFQVPASESRKLISAITEGKIHIITRNYFDNKVTKSNNSASKQRYSFKNIPSPVKFQLPPPPKSIKMVPAAANYTPSSPEHVLPNPASPSKKTREPKYVELIQANVKSHVSFNSD